MKLLIFFLISFCIIFANTTKKFIQLEQYNSSSIKYNYPIIKYNYPAIKDNTFSDILLNTKENNLTIKLEK